VVLGENAQASLVETFVSGDSGPAFVNAVAEVYLGPHATLDQTTLQEQGKATLHLGSLFAHQDRGSQLFAHVFSLGGRVARTEMSVALHGEGSGVTLDGLFLAKGDQQVELKTLVDHAKPHCGSQEYVKGILDDRARGAFEGRIVVRPHALKTDAHQKNRNLVLSRQALVDTKPQLEIYNDDVKCTHGSSTGRLDGDALFYLRSRGLSEAAARALLTSAFAAEIAARVKVEAVREYLHHRILGWLPAEAA
jgi:Fe-S cluster assembly protein SufD